MYHDWVFMGTGIYKKKGVTMLTRKLWDSFVTYVLNYNIVTDYANYVF
jgi:hypothetical protein